MFIVQLKNVGKKYLLEYRNRLSIKESFLNLCKGAPKRKEFWALKEINLDIPKGQTLGVIGRNGSGKTTFLKLLCGVIKPTEGSLKVNGRVVGLLELGAGFQGDLTGRENIYLNGSILGLSRRQIQRNIDSIIDFADIGEFIDALVRTYSAGMYLRLGFAIAMHVNPDILLIDEVLAVGDAAFQNRCLDKITEFKKEGKTIVFVSHNLNMVRQICERVILIDKSNVITDRDPDTVINRYICLMDDREIKWPTKEIEITSVYFKNREGKILNKFMTGEELKIVIEYFAHKKIENPVFGIGIYREGIYLIGPNTRDDEYGIDYVEHKGTLEYIIRMIPFCEGRYKVSISVHNIDETDFYDYHEYLYEFRIIPGQKEIKHGLMSIEDGFWDRVK